MRGSGLRAALVTTGVVLLVLVVYSRSREDARRTVAAPARVDVAAAPPSDPAAAPAAPTPSEGTRAPSDPAPPAGAALPAAPAYETAGEARGGERPASYAVVRGDSLWKIARRFYGDGRFARAIYEANRDQIQRPQLLHPGQELVLP